MHIIIFSIYFLATLIIEAHSDDGDDPAAINEEIFGKDKFCFFAFGTSTDPSNMHKYNSPNAQKYGMGYIDKHRVTFAWTPELKEPDITMVPDDKEKVFGIAYSVPLCEFEKIKNNLDTYAGVKFLHSVKKTVEVQKDGKTVTLSCNTFPTVAEPPPKGELLPPKQRPDKDSITGFVKSYQVGGLPADYIDSMSKTPIKEC